MSTESKTKMGFSDDGNYLGSLMVGSGTAAVPTGRTGVGPLEGAAAAAPGPLHIMLG